MGPGAAATFDPELGKKIEGIEPRATQDYLGKHVAELMNKVSPEQLQKLYSQVVSGKQKEVPKPVRERLTALYKAIDQWQGGSTSIASMAQDIVTGKNTYPKNTWGVAEAMHIINGIMNAPERRGTLFRGMRSIEPLEKFDNLKPNDVMRIDRPWSFSTSYEAAQRFTKQHYESGVRGYRIIVADRFKGLDAKANYNYNDEHEVLSYGRFRVIKNTVDNKGVRNIVVRQLEVHGPQESVKLKDEPAAHDTWEPEPEETLSGDYENNNVHAFSQELIENPSLKNQQAAPKVDISKITTKEELSKVYTEGYMTYKEFLNKWVEIYNKNKSLPDSHF